jgi:hypothetical protein
MCEQFGTPAQVRFPRWIPSGGDPEVMAHSGGLGLWGTPVSPSGGTVAAIASVERCRYVGFTPDSGRMAATERTDALGLGCVKTRHVWP